MKTIVATDWDGVLIEHPCNIPFEEVLTYGPPKDAVKTVNYLVEAGVEIYVLTARPNDTHNLIRMWLKKHGYPEMEVTNIKKDATMYLDDRAYRFTNWTDISKLLK